MKRKTSQREMFGLFLKDFALLLFAFMEDYIVVYIHSKLQKSFTGVGRVITFFVQSRLHQPRYKMSLCL